MTRKGNCSDSKFPRMPCNTINRTVYEITPHALPQASYSLSIYWPKHQKTQWNSVQSISITLTKYPTMQCFTFAGCLKKYSNVALYLIGDTWQHWVCECQQRLLLMLFSKGVEVTKRLGLFVRILLSSAACCQASTNQTDYLKPL